MPLSEPIKGVDGKMIHELVIPKDTTVCIGVLSSNTNKTIWGEDAMEWKPERWLAPLPPSVADAHIPNVYANTCAALPSPSSRRGSSDTGMIYRMTFIAGPRACMCVNFSHVNPRTHH